MDGGGRLLGPLTAGAGAAGVGLSAGAFRPALPPLFPNLLSVFKRRRRRGASRTPNRRLPPFLGSGLTLAFFGAVGAFGFVTGGHDAEFRAAYGEPYHAIARLVGLGLEKVTISGIGQLEEREVLTAAGLTAKTSLAFLSVTDVRQRLENVPLIKRVSVRKLYPNELVITLVEREAQALWQLNGELFLVAADGTVIDEMRDGRFAGLPLVVGEGANIRTDQYFALLEAAGPLKDRIRAGTLVSGRRWTLKMNGIDVRLPEEGAADAIRRLVKLEQDSRLLEKDVIAIDLRMSDRVVVRVTEEAFATRAEAVKKRMVRGKGLET